MCVRWGYGGCVKGIISLVVRIVWVKVKVQGQGSRGRRRERTGGFSLCGVGSGPRRKGRIVVDWIRLIYLVDKST